ncbi:MAG: flavin-containing monooxygenase [Candidatus Limnocylindria bacterium]
MRMHETERVDTIVIGGGQAGLSVGYHLARRDDPFVILDASARIGDSWRSRWDSLRLFTPGRFDGLDGMAFPAGAHSFPTKDAMGDYLDAYAARFRLPVRSGVEVDGLSKQGDRFLVAAGDRRFEADQVVVAMSNYQKARVPAFASELDPRIFQLHSADYRNPAQLRAGGVLIVGAGNSGSEIGMELARHHTTWLSGRDTGHIPFRIGGFAARAFLARLALRFVFHRVLTVATPVGRKARPKVISKGGPLIRVMPADMAAAGIMRVPRMTGVRDGLPLLDDGRTLDVANVVWCTGFRQVFDWIDLPILDRDGWPAEYRGVVESAPGLFFCGLSFQYAFSSMVFPGVGRDADYIAGKIGSRSRSTVPAAA